MTLAVVVALLVAIRLAGVPISVGLGVTGAVILFAYERSVMPIADAVTATLAQPVLITIPLFLFMAKAIMRVGIVDDLVETAQTLVGHLRGGLGLATVLASTVFAAISGSSVATTLGIGASAVPRMVRAGHTEGSAVGLVVACGTLGVLVPPSMPMILYALAAGLRIDTLFLASLVPGLLVAGLFALYAVAAAPAGARSARAEGARMVAALGHSFAVLLLPPLILGSLYFRLLTTLEAAAVGAVYALAVVLLAPRRLGAAALAEVAIDTLRTTVPIFALIVGAGIFSAAVAAIGVPMEIAGVTGTFREAPLLFVAIVLVVLFVAAAALDTGALILITTPLLLPALTVLGVDLVWYGVALMIALEAATIAPPVGLSLFVAKSLCRLPHGEVMRAAAPYLALMMVSLVLLAAAPWLATAVPATSGHGL